MILVDDMYLLHRAFFYTTIDTYTMVYDMYLSHRGFFPKAGYYADPIPSFRFWFGRKNKYNYSCKIKIGFLCGDGARVILCFARVIQQLRFWTHKIQANVDYCYVRRRAECTSLGPRLEHPSLRSDSSLAAKRRADALHVVFLFNKASEPSTRATALCVLSHDT